MALRALPSRKYWELVECQIVKENGDLIHQSSQRTRIAAHHLRAHGAHAQGKATLKRLMDLVRRLDRGLLSYGRYSAPELMVFADARGMEYPRDRKRMKKAMVEVLERADDNARFTRIMELPAELLVKTYVYYCLDLGQWFALGPRCVPLQTNSRH